jgi:hypothetical protein
VLLPLLGLLVGVLAGLVLNVNVGFELSRYSAVAILAALDSVLGAVRAELDGVYDNRIFISGFLVNAIGSASTCTSWRSSPSACASSITWPSSGAISCRPRTWNGDERSGGT